MQSEQGTYSAEQGIQAARFLENREFAAVREQGVLLADASEPRHAPGAELVNELEPAAFR
jgi:hypothetical protein